MDRDTRKLLLTLTLLAAAIPVLGFTACGLYFGLIALFAGPLGTLWVSFLGFGCAAFGGLFVWIIARAVRRVRKSGTMKRDSPPGYDG